MTRQSRLTAAAVFIGVGIALAVMMIGATGRDTSAGLGTFDLGDGREVRVWRQPHFGDPSSLWFEAARGGELLRPPYCLGTAGRGWYDVKTVWSADRAVSCTYSARLVPVRTESPDPTTPPASAVAAAPVTLVGANVEPRGFGPTARTGRPGEQEPDSGTLLMPGMWHIEAWATSVSIRPPEFDGATRTRQRCALDFELRAGHTLSLSLAHGRSAVRRRRGPRGGRHPRRDGRAARGDGRGEARGVQEVPRGRRPGGLPGLRADAADRVIGTDRRRRFPDRYRSVR